MKCPRTSLALGVAVACLVFSSNAYESQGTVSLMGLETGGDASTSFSDTGLAFVIETLAGLQGRSAPQPSDVKQASQFLGSNTPFLRPASVLGVEVESSIGLPLRGGVQHVTGHAGLAEAFLENAAPLPLVKCQTKACIHQTVEAVARSKNLNSNITFEDGEIRDGTTRLPLTSPAVASLMSDLATLWNQGDGRLSLARTFVLGVSAVESEYGADSQEATLARQLLSAVLSYVNDKKDGFGVVIVYQAQPGSFSVPERRRLAEQQAGAPTVEETTARAVAWMAGIALLLLVVGTVYVMLGAENRSDTSLFGVAKSHTA